jgi:sugar transferase (PEP-CTERM/EpsH1 system associated)
MRLLWMKSDYVIPPDTGGKIRTYHLLRELHPRCKVTYLSFKDPAASNGDARMRTCASDIVTVYRCEENKDDWRFYARVLQGMLSPLPYILQKYRSRAIHDYQQTFCQARAGTGHEPVILCDFLEMAANVNWSTACPKVLFQHNVESDIWRRYHLTERNPLKKAYFQFEQRRMMRYERRVCNQFDLIFVVSEKDKQTLRDSLGVTRPIEVLETGVDTDYYAPRTDISPQPGRLLFLGSLDWMPNIDGVRWFVSRVYPLIKAVSPSVSLDIVGRRPVEAIRRLVRGDASLRLAADVPDVRPYIAAADLFVVPLRIGGGARLKIYEAMAMGRPVVSTTIGAEGLPLRAGEDVAVGDSPAALADQIVRLLRDDSAKAALAASGYQLVTENYRWNHIAQKLYDCCRGLTSSLQLVAAP